METLVSVIIPVFNAEKYIKKCIDSIVKQTFTNFEIIIINDGSTDGTQEILNKYIRKYPENLRVFCQKNAGQSVARNKAMNYVRGKYVVFLDGDDYLEKKCLQRLFEEAERTQAIVVVCGHNRITRKGKVLSKVSVICQKASNNRWGKQNIGVVWAQMFLVDFLKEEKFRFAPGKIYEDVSYSMKARFLSKEIRYIDYIGYNYVIHESSTMRQASVTSDRFPFKEFEQDINEIVGKTKKIELFEMELLTFFSGFLFLTCKGSSLKDLHRLCEYAIYILDTYMKSYREKKITEILRFPYITILQKMAVIVFVASCRKNNLYNIAKIITRI